MFIYLYINIYIYFYTHLKYGTKAPVSGGYIFVSPRHWILNAVPAIGTHASLKFIKEKFLVGELTIAESAQALLASVHMVTADTEAIKIAEVDQHSEIARLQSCAVTDASSLCSHPSTGTGDERKGSSKPRPA